MASDVDDSYLSSSVEHQLNAQDKTSGKNISCKNLFEAAQFGELDKVKYFVDVEKVNIDSKDEECGRTALHYASEQGHSEVVKWLVRAGANFNAESIDNHRKDKAIHLAGNLSVVRYFIEDVDENMTYWKNGRGEIPMLRAAGRGTLDVVKYYILEKRVNVETKDDYWGRTALHHASAWGQLEVVKLLIESGANVKTKSNDNDYNLMPIHLAAYFGHLAMVKFFIEEIDEAMIYSKNGNGENAMLLAASSGRLDVLKYFIIDKKVNIELKDDRLGRTVLHKASIGGHLQVVEWLIQTGANVNAKSNDSDGNELPIHCATYFGQFEVVNYFVTNFPELKLFRNGSGLISLDIAEQNDHANIATFLQEIYRMRNRN